MSKSTLLSPNDFATVLQGFKADYALYQSRILVCVGNDVDALCAQYILTFILQQEGLLFQVSPVSSYQELRVVFEQHLRNKADVRNIILINCGATIDLMKNVFVDNVLSPEQNVFVFDHNRPIHLHNILQWPKDDEYPSDITERNQISLIASGNLDVMEKITKIHHSTWMNRNPDFRAEMYHQVSNDFSDDGSVEEDDEEMEDANFGEVDDDELNDFIVPDSNDEREEDDFEVIDEDDQALPFRVRVRRHADFTVSEVRDLKEIAQYYASSSYGVPTCIVMYEAIMQTPSRQILLHNKTIHNSALWALIIGFTSQYVKNRLSIHQYNEFVDKYSLVVLESNGINRGVLQTGSGVVTEATSEVRIVYNSNDYIFALYRHWDLYNSMLNTPLLFANIHDWGQNQERVHQFLAKIGVPLNYCRESFITMPTHSKETFSAGANSHGILLSQRIHLRTFVRHYGVSFEASSLDMVYILNTLMNKPLNQTTEVESIVDSKIWGNNYQLAVEALVGNLKVLKEGVISAIQAQKRIVTQLKSVFSTQSIRTDDLSVSVNLGKAITGDSGHFIRENSSHGHHSFTFVLTPNGLSELAQLLITVLEKMGKYKKPLILIAPSSNGHEVVVGVDRIQTTNCFNYAFNKAARSLNLEIRQVGFSTGMVEVRKTDRINLLSALMHEFCLSLGKSTLD